MIEKFSKDDVLYFGKYQGDTVAKIAVVNPSYLLWANKVVNEFKLDDEALSYVNEMMALASAHSKRGRYYLDDYEIDGDFGDDWYDWYDWSSSY